MPKCRVKRHSVTQPLDQSYRLIPLTQGKNAIVDTADFDYLSQWNWCAGRQRNTFYCVRGNGAKRLYMHRALSGGGSEVDHRNGNGLDNRRQNLRPCSHAQNTQNCQKHSHNKSGFKGVCWYESRGWRARITVNRAVITLGYFATAEEAAHIYDEAAKKFHGEFARLNFHCPSLR